MRLFARLLAVAAAIAALSACTDRSASPLPYTNSHVRHVQDSGGGIPDAVSTPPV